MSEILKTFNLTTIGGNVATNLTTNVTTNANTSSSSEKFDLSSGFVDLPQNYSILINKLEQLALGLDSALVNFTIDRKEVEIALTNGGSSSDVADDLLFGVGDPIAAGRAPPPHMGHAGHSFTDDAEDFAHVVSDIWIGVILTLLIVFVIFFICACLLYHKFQQWKHSYRANRNEPVAVEICRRCPPDYEVESLPSYTIVSGLPSYDDALEEFRKAGIILKPSFLPVIKIFESNEANRAASKDIYSVDNTQPPPSFNEAVGSSSADTISLSSTTCACGGSSVGPVVSAGTLNAPHPLAHIHGDDLVHQTTMPFFGLSACNPVLSSQVIELSPEHLAVLSQKRLSLQIAFNSSGRRQSNSGSTLRYNLLRSRVLGNTAGMGPIDTPGGGNIAMSRIHRSSSTNSLTNEQNLLDQRLRHLHHRGSLY